MRMRVSDEGRARTSGRGRRVRILGLETRAHPAVAGSGLTRLRDRPQRREAQRRHPRVSARDEYRTLGEALGQLDAVIIAAPPTLHAPLALEAIARGVHVLVEKPLAPTVKEGQAMVRAAEKKGVTLMVGHTFEYHSAVWELRSMVQRGDLGDLYYLDTAQAQPRPVPTRRQRGLRPGPARRVDPELRARIVPVDGGVLGGAQRTSAARGRRAAEAVLRRPRCVRQRARRAG